MAESDIHVVFDPFVLSDALLGPEDSIYYKAFDTLVQNCPNKLVVDDESGKLGEAYQRALQEVFISLRSQLA